MVLVDCLNCCHNKINPNVEPNSLNVIFNVHITSWENRLPVQITKHVVHTKLVTFMTK